MQQKGNFSIILAVVVIAVFGGLWFLGKGSESPGEQVAVKIGWMGPLTDDAATYGESIKKGVELAARDANLNIEVLYEDTKCDAKEAVNAAQKLINVDKVVAIVGDVCSGATLAAVPVAEAAKVVMISGASTAPKITEAGQYIFRTIPSDALQGEFGAKLVSDKGFKKLAILYGNEEYGVGFEKVLNEKFTALGGTVVASESFQNNATDLRTQLTKIKAAKPDALYIVSNSPSSASAALKQAKELKITTEVFGSEGLKSPDILTGAGTAAEGLTVTSVTAGTPDFILKWQAAYGTSTTPGPFAAQGYDAFMAITKALTANVPGGTSMIEHSEALPEYLLKTEFDGASGHIKFDQNGDVAGNYEVYRVEKGAFVPAK